MSGLDWLFLLLVLVPFFSGGFWVQSDRFKIEFTDVGLGFLLFLVIALFFVRVLNRKSWWEDSKIRELGRVLFYYLDSLSLKQITQRVFLVSLVPTLLWSAAALYRHWAFQSNAADLGIFTNVIWNIAFRGEIFSSIKGGVHFFTDHQMLLLPIIGRLYRIAPSPEVLLVVQSVALVSSGIAVLLLAAQRGQKGAYLAIVPIVFWLYVPVRSANLFDFHPEAFMLPLFLFGIYFLQEKWFWQRLVGLVLVSLGALSKESGGPVLCAISLAWISGFAPFRTKYFMQRIGVGTFLFGVFLFWFQTKQIPQSLGSNYSYGELYHPFGSDLISLIIAPFRFPMEFLERLFGIARLKFLFLTLAPLGFVPLLNWRGLLPLAIPYLMLFLGRGDQRISTGFHYGIEPAVLLFFCFSGNLGKWKKLTGRLGSNFSVVLLCGLAILFSKRSEIFHIRKFQADMHAWRLRKMVLPLVPESVSVAASSSIVPHISNRRWIHYLPNLSTKMGPMVDCVIWDSALNNSPMSGEESSALSTTLKESYKIVYQEQSLHVYIRVGFEGRCLAEDGIE